MNAMRRHLLLGCAFLMMALLPVSPASAQDAAPRIFVIEATGPIVDPFAAYVSRGIDEANQANAEAIIIVLDTPGGRLDVTFDLIKKITNSRVPVIVFVGPGGAKAASAGTLITASGHVAAMAPNTAIGAASVVGPGGAELPDTAARKAENYVAAQMRSLVERRGDKAVRLAEQAITEAKAVTAAEARDANLIDFVADDVDDLLRQVDGFQVTLNGETRSLRTANATLIQIRMTVVEELLLTLLQMVADPNINFLLLAGGILLIIVEFASPGGWVFGTAGVISLGLALYGIGVLPVNWLGLVFVGLAFALFMLDVKAPTHGLLTFGAIISLISGAIILFGQSATPFGQLSIPLVVGFSIVMGGVFFFVVMMAVRAQGRPSTTGLESLIGKVGRVSVDIDPSGAVIVWGETWRAESVDGKRIAAGAAVEVVEATARQVKVRPK